MEWSRGIIDPITEKYKDDHIKLGIKNWCILRAMKNVGIPSIAELARQSGVSKTLVHCYINYQTSPKLIYSEAGAWKPTAIKLATVLDVYVSELFPQYAPKTFTTNCIERYVEEYQRNAPTEPPLQLTPFESAALSEERDIIDGVLDTLSERIQRVLRARFWENKTLEQVALDFNVTKERIRQLEAKGLRMLRHHTRIRKLEKIMYGEEGEKPVNKELWTGMTYVQVMQWQPYYELPLRKSWNTGN